MELEEDFLDISPFRRVRVLMDVSKPLKRYQMIRVQSEKNIKITLKYERLPFFCFLCGLLSHTEKDCSNVMDEDKEAGYRWGLDIRASPRKGLSKNKEEVDAIKMKRILFVTKPKLPPPPPQKEKMSYDLAAMVSVLGKGNKVGEVVLDYAAQDCSRKKDSLVCSQNPVMGEHGESVRIDCVDVGSKEMGARLGENVERVCEKHGAQMDVGPTAGGEPIVFNFGAQGTSAKRIVKVKRRSSEEKLIVGASAVLPVSSSLPC
ncbi:unnamed protein product [Amaranthus hypochondriacus]